MSGFPSEAWPADLDVQALDGTMDAATGLPYIAKGTGPTSVPSYEVQYNRRLQRLNRILAGWRQGMVVDEGGLKIGVYPIHYTSGGQRRSFSGASGVSIPDDSSKVVYLDAAAALQVADAWPMDVTQYLPLASVSASDGVLTIVDRRGYTAFQVPSVEVGLPLGRQVLTVHRASVGNNESATKIYEFDPNVNYLLEEVQVFCRAMSATANVDVREAGVSMLTSPVTLSAGAVLKGTVSDGSLSAANSLSVHVTTNASGTVSDLTVTLVLKGPLG